jgi:hypothetical protein
VVSTACHSSCHRCDIVRLGALSLDTSTAVRSLIATQPLEDARRGFLSRSPGERLRQVLQVGTGRLEVAGRPQAVDRTLIRQWREHGHRPTPVGDLDPLAGLDPSQQLAGALTQFTNAC